MSTYVVAGYSLFESASELQHPTPAVDARGAGETQHLMLLQIDMETMTLCGASCALGG